MEKAYSGLKKFKKELILGPLFKVVEVIFELLTPFLMSYIINVGITEASNGQGYGSIIYPALIMVLFTILGFASTSVCQYFASIASQGFGTDLRNKIFKKVLSLSSIDLENFDKSFLINLVNNDSNRLQLSVAMLIRLVIRAPILVIGSLICSFIISVEIGFIFLVLVPVIAFFIFLIFYLNNKQFFKVQKSVDGIVNYSNDSLRGIRYIKAFNKEDYTYETYKGYTKTYYNEVKKANLIAALVNPITFFIINIAILLVAYFGGSSISDGVLEQGDVVALVSYLSQIFTALIVVTNLVVIFNRAFTSKKRIDSLLMYESKLKDDGQIDKLKINRGENILSFENVSFKYDDSENEVVKNLNFSIKKGDQIGIIGGTGSGKTTIIKLIERFFDVTSGNLYYKGHNIKDYKLENLRNEISLINQNSVLFNGTIKDNVKLGKLDATDEEIVNALKMSEAYSFISKYSDTINHEVLEGGKNFSGGQKQRISLARGLIKDSEILIIDDSTSALDYLTEQKVRNNIHQNKVDLTTITISQRISSIINSDMILVVDNGQIVGSGRHDELLKSCEIYKEIYESQSEDK